MSDLVRVERKGRVTTVILNRPASRNAVNGPTAAALCAAFEQFDRDDAASVAVLWGAGGTFCAGADLKAFGTPEANSVHRTGPGPMGPSRMMLSKPVIAAVSGYAVAGGLELALWCDLRVAEEDAVFGVFCRRWGVPLIDGGTVRLPRLIGHSRAMDMILTGRGVPADEALAMGLANRVVPKGQARQAAEELAATPSTSSVAGLTVGKVPARPSDSLPSMSSALIPSPHRAIYRSQLLRLSSSIGHLSDIASSRPYPQGRYTVLTDAPGATSRRGQSHVSCMFSRLACLLPRPSDSLDMCPAMYWLPPRPSAKPNPTPKRCHATAASRQPSARC